MIYKTLNLYNGSFLYIEIAESGSESGKNGQFIGVYNRISELKKENEHLKHDINRQLNITSSLATENEHRAEVINKRDGTIKQLQKRVRTLESDVKIVEHPNDCGCYYCTPII